MCVPRVVDSRGYARGVRRAQLAGDVDPHYDPEVIAYVYTGIGNFVGMRGDVVDAAIGVHDLKIILFGAICDGLGFERGTQRFGAIELLLSGVAFRFRGILRADGRNREARDTQAHEREI